MFSDIVIMSTGNECTKIEICIDAESTNLSIKFLGLFWVRSNRFTRLFWLLDRGNGLYIARVLIPKMMKLPSKKGPVWIQL